MLSHYTARGETLFFVDGTLAGTVAERLEPNRFGLGGAQADYRDLLIYRSALNADEVAALESGRLLQASLEVYSPLTDDVPAGRSGAEPRAEPDVSQSRRAVSNTSAGNRMADFLRDLKHSLRMFRQTPGFTLAALAALTLGIGANTAIFSVVNSVLLKPLPFPDPDRLVLFLNVGPNGSGSGASVPKFNVWREQTPAFQDAAAYRFGVMNLTGGDSPEQLPSARVTADFFRLFGAQTAVGRTFTADEDRPNGGKVVVLSYGFWQRRFGGDPQVVGRTLPLSGDSYVVIGVLAPSFNSAQFDPFADVWTPFQMDPASTDQAHYFTAAARLKPGVTLAMANTQMQAAAEQFRAKFPKAIGPKARLRRAAAAGAHGAQRQDLAAGAGRRRQLRAADRVRERREPAAGARHRPEARDRHSRRDGRRPRPHRPAAADRERAAVAGRRSRSGSASAWPASARCWR